MNNPLRILAGVIVCSVTLPIFLSVVSYDDIETNTPQKQEQLIEKKSSSKYINYETVDKDSPKINIYNHKTGKTQQMDIEEYLYGVLSGEMPSDFMLMENSFIKTVYVKLRMIRCCKGNILWFSLLSGLFLCFPPVSEF